MGDTGGRPEQVIEKGLPSDWARVRRGPQRYVLPADWKHVMMRYAGLGSATPLDHMFNETVGKQNPTLALLESGYVDEDFRDEYIHFYARTYRELPRRCERLHFFDGAADDVDKYLGYIVLRPIVGRPVSRTMLRPPTDLKPHVSCVARYTTTPWGYLHNVDGFPFMSQDSQFGSCAHAAIWMISLYFHLRFRRPRYHLSDIVRSARRHQGFHRALPSHGLTPSQISAVLHDLDMTPVIYPIADALPNSPELTPVRIAARYLSSGLPVMLLTEDCGRLHVEVLIGFGSDANGFYFIHHDDQRGPYLKTYHDPQANEGIWQALVVPMPGKIYLSGEAALQWTRAIIDETIAQNDLDDLSWVSRGLATGTLQLRAYVTEVADYKRKLRRRGLHQDVVQWHESISTSHWLWVIEVQRTRAAKRSSRCVIGELVIDATSDDEWVNPLFGNLPGLTMQWPDLGDRIELVPSGQGRAPYDSGCLLHNRT